MKDKIKFLEKYGPGTVTSVKLPINGEVHELPLHIIKFGPNEKGSYMDLLDEMKKKEIDTSKISQRPLRISEKDEISAVYLLNQVFNEGSTRVQPVVMSGNEETNTIPISDGHTQLRYVSEIRDGQLKFPKLNNKEGEELSYSDKKWNQLTKDEINEIEGKIKNFEVFVHFYVVPEYISHDSIQSELFKKYNDNMDNDIKFVSSNPPIASNFLKPKGMLLESSGVDHTKKQKDVVKNNLPLNVLKKSPQFYPTHNQVFHIFDFLYMSDITEKYCKGEAETIPKRNINYPDEFSSKKWNNFSEWTKTQKELIRLINLYEDMNIASLKWVTSVLTYIINTYEEIPVIKDFMELFVSEIKTHTEKKCITYDDFKKNQKLLIDTLKSKYSDVEIDNIIIKDYNAKKKDGYFDEIDSKLIKLTRHAKYIDIIKYFEDNIIPVLINKGVLIEGKGKTNRRVLPENQKKTLYEYQQGSSYITGNVYDRNRMESDHIYPDSKKNIIPNWNDTQFYCEAKLNNKRNNKNIFEFVTDLLNSEPEIFTNEYRMLWKGRIKQWEKGIYNEEDLIDDLNEMYGITAMVNESGEVAYA